MKVRDYLVENLGKGLYFCPNCHREITLPFKGIEKVQIQSSLNITCGNCKQGLIKIRVKSNGDTIR